ncbi:hypothetical protein [Microbacterium paraoxydans]|uniref:hypothetical protein n=1 Tax=Microbacterium paraoxydans TaxID=199592 RepID=UPI0004687556|nr:hypothetical protein [Microbacterium paraoxydans]
MSAGDRKPGQTLECHRCHRIGTRGFVPWGSEGWECSNDRACNTRLHHRDKPNPRQMSQAELNDHLDHLVTQDLDDTPEFHHAHTIWERTQ